MARGSQMRFLMILFTISQSGQRNVFANMDAGDWKKQDGLQFQQK